ncbi:MAG: TerC family protein [Proteobacteria bacterium]|nr:TerC family protein [Pseudomonadota bacterium]
MELLSALLFGSFLGTPGYFWLIFIGLVATLLAFDLGVLHRGNHEISARESFMLYGGYVAVAAAFGAWVWWSRGAQAGLEFYTGYIIEQSLAMDNIFVIATIFAYFSIPRIYQHRVLFWGILGAIIMRALMIGLGAALVIQFNWILYLFGAFLVFTGYKMFSAGEGHADLDNNMVLQWLRRHFPITREMHGERFTVQQPHPKTGKMVTWLTPLAVALILVEVVDLIFAVDSVPAIFAVTLDPFIVYTSNIFAILGLRSLYFALAAAMHRFKYLKVSLAVILILVGIKIFLVPMGVKIDTLLSLVVTIVILASGILYSLWKTRNEPAESQA